MVKKAIFDQEKDKFTSFDRVKTHSPNQLSSAEISGLALESSLAVWTGYYADGLLQKDFVLTRNGSGLPLITYVTHPQLGNNQKCLKITLEYDPVHTSKVRRTLFAIEDWLYDIQSVSVSLANKVPAPLNSPIGTEVADVVFAGGAIWLPVDMTLTLATTDYELYNKTSYASGSTLNNVARTDQICIRTKTVRSTTYLDTLAVSVVDQNNPTDTATVTETFSSSATAPTYALSSNLASLNEGQTVVFSLSTTAVPDGTQVPYTITGIQSADLSAGSLTGNFTITSNSGTQSFTLDNDLATEGAETMLLTLNNNADSHSVVINDTSTAPAASYSLSRSAASVNEGGSVNITLTTTNISNGVNVPYTITGISSSDLSSGSMTGNFTINNNTSVLSFTLAEDNLTEGAETLSLALDNGQDTITVAVNDTSLTQTFALSSSVSAVNEGSSVSITLTTTNVPNSTNIPYTVTGIQGADLSAGSLTGNFNVQSNSSTVTFTLDNDLLTEGTETLTLALDNGAATVNVTVNDTSVSAATYSLSTSAASINEGQSVTITLTTTNVSNGVNLPYTVSGINSADLSAGSLTGNFSIYNNTATQSFTLANDLTTEGAETMVVALDNGASSVNVSVADTSTTPAATYSLASSAASINEGQSVTFTLTTTNVSNATNLPFTVTGIQSADLSAGSLTGNFTVNNNSATQTFTLASDNLTEGAETLSIALDNGQASSSCVINDTSTSTPTYSMYATEGTSMSSPSITAINEGLVLAVHLDTTNISDGTTLPYTITGVSSSDLSGASLTGNLTVNSNHAMVSYTVAADATTEGTETFTFSLDNGQASVNVTINDTSTTPVPTYTLSRSAASVNEGSSVDITLTTTNLANGNVPYTITGISSADLSSGSLTGNFAIVGGTATLTFGLSADNLSEGAETLSLALDNGADTITVTVNDTSFPPPTYALASNVSSVNEGGSVDITLTTTNVVNGTNVPYTITGIVSSDLSSGSITGNFTVNSNSATLTFGIQNDNFTEGAETMTLTLDGMATNVAVTINDTSVTPFTFNNYYALEGSNTSSAVHEWELTGTEKSLWPSLGNAANTFPSYTDGFSVSFWLKIQTGAEGGGTIGSSSSMSVFHQQVGTNGAGIQALIDNTGRMKVVMSAPTLNNYQITTANTTMTGSWFHFTLVYQSNGYFDVYKDGTQISVTTSSAGSTGTISSELSNATISNLLLDTHYITVGGGSDRARATRWMRIDEVMGIKKALSATEVTELYNSGAVQPNTSLSFNSDIDSHFRMGDHVLDDRTTFEFYDFYDTSRKIEDAYAGSQTVYTYDPADQPYYNFYDMTKSSLNVREGETMTVTLNTGPVANGTAIPYTITGITQADLSSGSLSGNFIINNNTGSVTVALAEDSVTENHEKVTLALNNGQASVVWFVSDKYENRFFGIGTNAGTTDDFVLESPTSGELSLFPSYGTAANTMPQSSDPISMSWWVNLANGLTNQRVFFMQQVTGSAIAQIKCDATSAGISWRINRDGMPSGLAKVVAHNAVNVIGSGTWHQITVTKGSGNPSTSNMNVYIDGVKQALTAADDSFGTNLTEFDGETVSRTMIGNSCYRNSYTGVRTSAAKYADGFQMDEVICFKKELTEEDALELYGPGRPVDPDKLSFSSDIESYFRMGDGPNDVVGDYPYQTAPGSYVTSKSYDMKDSTRYIQPENNDDDTRIDSHIIDSGMHTDLRTTAYRNEHMYFNPGMNRQLPAEHHELELVDATHASWFPSMMTGNSLFDGNANTSYNYSISFWYRGKIPSSSNYWSMWEQELVSAGGKMQLGTIYVNNNNQWNLAWSQGGSRIRSTINMTASDTAWNHYVFAAGGGNNGMDNLTVYKNGVSMNIASTSNTLPSGTPPSGNVYAVRVGDMLRNWSSTGSGSYSFYQYTNGHIARFAQMCTWSKQLTQQDVTDLYNSGTPVDPSAHAASGSLERWLKFGDQAGDGSTMHDYNDSNFKLDTQNSVDHARQIPDGDSVKV